MYIRTANLKLNTINTIYSNNNIDDFLTRLVNTEEFINMIKIVSPSLYTSILNSSNIIENKSVIFSLIKYILRMSSRTVNYDLLGNISSSDFNKSFIKILYSNEWLDMISRQNIKFLNVDMTYNHSILSIGQYFF